MNPNRISQKLNLRRTARGWLAGLVLSVLAAIAASAQVVPGPDELRFTSTNYFATERESVRTTERWDRSFSGVRLTVTRVGSARGAVQVDFTLQDGTAIFGSHYGFSSGTLVFRDYEMSRDIIVPIIDDTEVNETRTFMVTLAEPRALDPEAVVPVLSDTHSAATVEILDDDAGFNFGRAVYRAAEAEIRSDQIDNGRVVVKVHLAEAHDQNVTVRYEVVSGNRFPLQAGSDYATPGQDFTSMSGTLTFGRNDTSQDITIPISNDNLVEFAEDFRLRLTNPSGKVLIGTNEADATVGLANTTSVTIIFDDLFGVWYRTNSSGNVSNDFVATFGPEQPAGAVDVKYNPPGVAWSRPPYNFAPGANNSVYALVVQPDGQIVIGGDFTAVNTEPLARIARLDTNGWVDASFSIGTGVDGPVEAIAIYSSGAQAGKIVIGGTFTSVNGTQRQGIARLNADGTLDASFNPGSGVNGPVRAVAVQEDGKIVIGGEFTSVNENDRVGVARLNADGSVDSSFDPGFGTDAAVWAVALVGTNDAKVIIGGEFSSFDLVPRSGIARLNADGSLDGAFNPGSGADGVVFAIAVQPDGKAVIAGSFSQLNLQSRNNIARLNTNGSLDSSFDPGQGTDHAVFCIALQGDGRILIGGAFRQFGSVRRIGVARLLNHGPLDTSFLDTAYNQFAGILDPDNFVNGIGVQPDGEVLIGGTFSELGGGLTRSYARAGFDARGLPQFNIARLIGNSTPGPGNLELVTANYRVDEHAGALFATLMRTNGVLGPVFVAGSTRDGLAVAGEDYSGGFAAASWGSLWPNGSAGQPGWMVSDGVTNSLVFSPSIRVSIFDDEAIEGNETFYLDLTPPASSLFLGGEVIPLGVALGRYTATVTIADNDFSGGSFSFKERTFTVNENGTNAVITVVRTGGSTGNAFVDYMTADGTGADPALAGSDYTARNFTLTFASGQTNRTFTVPITDDTSVEPDESFFVRLSNPRGGAGLGSQTEATVTIIDNDYAPGRLAFAASSFSANEYGGFVTVAVRRTGGNAGAVAVRGIAANGTATSPADFIATNVVLNWSDGDSQDKTFTVAINNDGNVEPNETILLSLTNFVGALPGSQTNAVANIVNDDFYGALAFSSPTYIADEIGGEAIITVVRIGGVAGTVTVNFATGNLPPGPGSASSGTDYSPTNGTLTFVPGQLSATFTVRLSDDSALEGDEALRLTLSAPTGGAILGSPSVATLSIVDNESSNIPAGSLDTGFNPAASANGTINALALQPNGGLIIAGDFTLVNGVTRNGIARLLGDGALDGSFDAVAGLNGSARTLALQSDGRVLVGGLFTTINGTNRNRIARLNSDGSVDVSFNPGAGADNPVHALAVTTVDDVRKVLAGGAFSSINGISRNSIARLNDNGSVDSTFDPGSGANGPVYAIAVQPDGKVVVAGDFTVFNGSANNSIVRLNPDGSIDSTFNIGVGASGSVRALAVQTDGKIVAGGLFTSFGGTTNVGRLVRLNQDGSVDSSFNAGTAADGAVLSIFTQLDGKLIVAGEFITFDGISRRRLTRLNSDGSVDPSINFGSGANNFISALALQPDRKIIIAGGFTTFNEQPRNHLARLHGGSLAGAGSLEFAVPVFSATESGTNGQVVVRRAGGTFGTVTVNYAVTGGTATEDSDYTLANGTLTFRQGETRQVISVPLINDSLVEEDETVQLELSSPTGNAVIGNQPIATLTIVSDDSIVRFTSPSFTVIENFVTGNATISVTRTGAVSGTVRVNYSATPGTATAAEDFTPVSGSLVFEPGETVKVFSVPIMDDTLVEGNETINLSLSGLVGPAVLGTPSTAVLTINENDFSPGTFSFGAPAYRVAESNSSVTLAIIRTNGSSGTVSVRYSTMNDTATAGGDYTGINTTVAFGDGETLQLISIPLSPDTLVEGNETFDVILSEPTGGAVLSGMPRVVVTIDDDDFGPGSLDPAFDPGVGANGLVRSLAVQPNGRMVIGGAFTRFNGIDRNFVARLHSSGGLDFGFSAGGGPNGIVSAVAVDAFDGDILIGGSFTVVNGVDRARFARLTSAGAVDLNQDQPTGFDAAVYALAPQTDSKVLVGGAFQFPKSSLARVRVNGSADTSFDTGAGANGPIFAVQVDSNGDVVAGGSFSSFDGLARSRVVKLSSDGSIDLTFSPPTVSGGSVFAVAAQPDGKVVIAGDFTAISGQSRNRVARLNADGSLDTGFNPGSGANNTVYAAALQADGKVMLAGAFTSFNGVTRNRLARLQPNGTLDTNFEPGLGANNTVYTLALMPDGKILIGGDFTSVNGFVRNGVARLNGDAISSIVRIQPGFGFSANTFRLTISAVAGRNYTLQISSDLANWTTLTTATAAGPVVEFIDNVPDPSRRFYRVREVTP